MFFCLKLLELLHALLLLSLFFCFIFFDFECALAFGVLFPVPIFDVMTALFTFFGFYSTCLLMRVELCETLHFVAPTTWLWSLFTGFFMVSKLSGQSFKLAILTFDFDVFVGLVLLLIGLGHNHAALLAFVVYARALNFVHAELAGCNLLLAVLAKLGLFNFLNHFSII